MTEIIVKNNIDRQKLDSLVVFLKSWGIDAEIKPKTGERPTVTDGLFAESFGMWAGRDIDICEIRRKAYERRTKAYDNDTL